jgi:hypothetical protein
MSGADSYTFSTPPSSAPGGAPSLVGTLGAAFAKVAVSGFAQSAARWRLGSLLPAKVSAQRSAPVGTTFTFSLSSAATATLTFSQRVGGRRSGGSCVAPSPHNAGKPRCTRTVTAGTLSVPGHAGTNKLRFQGRVSAHKTLTPGAYTASLTAREPSGPQSSALWLSLTVLAH